MIKESRDAVVKFYIEPSSKRMLKQIASEKNMSISSLVFSIIDNYLQVEVTKEIDNFDYASFFKSHKAQDGQEEEKS